MDEDKKPEKMSQEAYFDTAIRAVRQKKPAPEIDFTLHTMDDGTQVSTTERVCKGTCMFGFMARQMSETRNPFANSAL
jgi:hypothetical protein